MKPIPTFLMSILLYFTPACGGDAHHGHDHGPGGHSHAESGEGKPDSDSADDHDHGKEVALGAATVGDMQVEFAQMHGPLVAGEESHLVIKLPYNDKGASLVRAWIGSEDRLQSMVGKGEYAPDHDELVGSADSFRQTQPMTMLNPTANERRHGRGFDSSSHIFYFFLQFFFCNRRNHEFFLFSSFRRRLDG